MPYRGNNYSFVIDSSFQPFSMQEMLVPFTAYKEAFEKSEEAYNDLKTKADVFKNLSSSLPEGSKARQIYEGYANDLNAQAADLANNGLTMGNRRALTGLKQRYQGEIGRLAQVDAIRKAQIKEQNELRLKDPTRLFSRRADLTDFDKYLENPDLTYDSYSGALLTQQVGSAASAIAKNLRDYSNGKPLDGFTKTWLQQHGYSAAEVAQAIQDPTSDKTGVLNSIVEQAVQSAGIPQWADDETLNKAYQYARQGLWNAVGQTSVATYTDKAAELSAQEAKEKRMADYNHNLKMAEQTQLAQLAGQQAARQKGNLPIFSDTIASPDMEGEKGKEIGTNLKRYIGTLRKDSTGQYVTDVNVSPGSSNTNYGLQIFNGRRKSNNKTVDVSLPMADNSGGLLSETEFATKGVKELLKQGVILSKEDYERSHKTQNSRGVTYEKYLEKMEEGLRYHYQLNFGNLLKAANLDAAPKMSAHSNKVQRLTISDVSKVADNSISGSGPYRVNAIELRFGTGRTKNKEVLEGMMPNLIKDGDKTHIKKIKRIAPDGTIELDSSNLDYDKFVDKNGKAVTTPTFWRINTPGGKNGMIIKMNGETYFAPGEYLGNTFRESNVDVDALVQLQQMKQSLINQYGEDAYYSSQQGLKIETAMDQYGAASVRGGSVSLSGGYNLPGYSLIETSEDQLE